MIFKNYKNYLETKEKLSEKYKGKFGCILEFNGFVREYNIKNGKKIIVEGLEIKEKNLKKLESLREKVIKKFDLIDVIFYQNVGFLKVGERITSVVVFAKHRKEAFLALSFIIDEIKKYHSSP